MPVILYLRPFGYSEAQTAEYCYYLLLTSEGGGAYPGAQELPDVSGQGRQQRYCPGPTPRGGAFIRSVARVLSSFNAWPTAFSLLRRHITEIVEKQEISLSC